MKNFMALPLSRLRWGRSFSGLVLFHHLRHGHHHVTLLEVDEADSLGVPAVDGDSAHRHPDHHPALGDHHDLIFVLHFADADHVATLLGGPDVDDPHASPPLDPIFLHGGPLSKAALRDREDVSLAGDSVHLHQEIVPAHLHAPHG